jgi:hypothetical protein
VSFPTSFRVLRRPCGRRRHARRIERSDNSSSLEVCSPSAYPRTGQRLEWPGLPRPTACAYRLSQPRGALIRPVPAGLISCQIRSWGLALQSFAPPAQPYAVSGAAALLTLEWTRTPHRTGHPRPPEGDRFRSVDPLRRRSRNNTGTTGVKDEPETAEAEPNPRLPRHHCGPPKRAALTTLPPCASDDRSRRSNTRHAGRPNKAEAPKRRPTKR